MGKVLIIDDENQLRGLLAVLLDWKVMKSFRPTVVRLG